MSFSHKEEFILYYDILKYLNDFQVIDKIEKQLYEFALELNKSQKKFPVFYFTLNIDILKLHHISGKRKSIKKNFRSTAGVRQK